MRYSVTHAARQVRQRMRMGAAVLTLVCAGPAVFAAPPPSQQDSAKKLIKQGVSLYRKGLRAEAEAALRRAVELEPMRSEAKVELAYVLARRWNLREAYDISLAVAEAERSNSRAFAVLGLTLLSAGRFADARTVLDQALGIDRREDLAWASLGLLEFYENRIERAYSYLRQAVAQKPREPEHLFVLGQVAARSERFTEAANAYEAYLSNSSLADAERRDRIRGLISFMRFLGERDRLYITASSRGTQVPFELARNRPVIEVRLNGRREPLRFVLDTGSSISVISTEKARRLKIKQIAKGGMARGIGGDGRFEIVYGFVREFVIGDVTVRNVPVYIRPFHRNYQGIDGYIGLSVISEFLTTVDYGERTFSLVRRNDQGEPAAMPWQPLRLTSSGFLSGEVALEGVDQALNFIVDTGASVSVISTRIASHSRISEFLSRERLTVIGAAGVTEDVPIFALPSVTFGGHSRRGLNAVALDMDILNEASGFEQAGILGGDFLSNYRLTFDFKRSTVAFSPISDVRGE